MITRIKHRHHVVVADLAHFDEAGVLTVPGVLVVQHHRPAHERLELRHLLVTVEDLLVGEGAEIRIVQADVKSEIPRVLQNLGDGRQDGRKLGGVIAAVAEQVKQPREDAVLELCIPGRRQPVVLGLNRGGFARRLFPGRDQRQEHIVTLLRHVPPSHRPLVVHGDREAIDPEQVQPQVAQQVVAALVDARLGALKQILAGRGLLFEVALHHGRELVERVEAGKIDFREEIRRQHEAAVPVENERFQGALLELRRAMQLLHR